MLEWNSELLRDMQLIGFNLAQRNPEWERFSFGISKKILLRLYAPKCQTEIFVCGVCAYISVKLKSWSVLFGFPLIHKLSTGLFAPIITHSLRFVNTFFHLFTKKYIHGSPTQPLTHPGIISQIFSPVKKFLIPIRYKKYYA